MSQSSLLTESRSDVEPVAIVGIACRFPGAPDLQSFWRLLVNGVDAISEVPPDRWDVNALYDPDPAAPGKMVTRWGGFLEGVDRFDAAFFGISPREANHIDPQQRMVMETTWEALEDAGIPPLSLAGSDTGVFIATLSTDYATDLFTAYSDRVDAYSGTGTTTSLNSARVSYFFDLHGPSLTVDTACSGSLAAVHLACESMRRGDCGLALAGGVNLILRPDGNLFFSKAGALSPDGRCKPFDSRANGIVRSDGLGILVLKPLARAQADGDEIYALVLGGAINQDGHSTGVMAPNGQAQQALLRHACRRAGVALADVQYIEAHGTGTNIGDPVEVQALGAVLSEGRPAGAICAIGSVKSNVGHAEAAAGAAGLIKLALSLKHRELPSTLHFQEANPLIPFDRLGLRVQAERGPWPAPDRPLIGGISGFGIGGTNAHLVLSEPPPPVPSPPAEQERMRILSLSARTPAALRQLAASYRELLAAGAAAPPFADVCYTASVRRSHLEQRLAVVAPTSAEAAERLADFAAGKPSPGLATGAVQLDRRPKLAMVFSGQGSHWCRMGRGLLASEPVFAEVVDRCDEALRGLASWSLVDQLSAPEETCRFAETAVAQPAIFAVQAGLAALWREWGVIPDTVVGQSLGEVAAAYVAGALDLADAVQVVFHRSRLMQRVAGQGATALVGLPLDQVELVLTGFGGELFVAGSSSPSATVVSGEPQALNRLLAALEQQGIFGRALRGVDVAFHSPQMDPLLPELEAALAGIRPRTATLRLWSTVTGGAVDGGELDASYWARNLRQPFRFAQAIDGLIGEDHETFLEVGPHAVLAGAIRQVVESRGREATVVASLRRQEDERGALLGTLAQLYTHGHPVAWSRVYPQPRPRVKLPSYPWQRRRFWLDQLREGGGAGGGERELRGAGGHPLLGLHVAAAQPAGEHLWERDLSSRSLHWLDEHRVQGATVLPATAHLEMARCAAEEAFGPGLFELEEVSFEAPLVLPADGGACRVQLVLTSNGSADARFGVYSRALGGGVEGGSWTLHSSGRIHSVDGVEAPPPLDLAAVEHRCPETVAPRDHYRRMSARGLEYGPSFQAVITLKRREGEAIARLRPTSSVEAEKSAYGLHPTLLDAAFQTVAATRADAADDAATFLPVGVERLRWFGRAAGELRCHAELAPEGNDPDERRADLLVVDTEGRAVAEVTGLRLRRLGGRLGARGLLHRVVWKPRERPVGTAANGGETPGWWLLLADSTGVAGPLEDLLEARGDWCFTALPGDGFRIEDGRRLWVDPRQPEQFRSLLREVTVGRRVPCRGIVDLWGLDAAATDQLSAGALDASLATGAEALLWTVQALAQADWERMIETASQGTWRQLPRLWIVTRGAQAVAAEERVAVAQAPIWGLGRVVLREHPELWGGLIDLDPTAPPERAAADLLGELAVRGAEPGVAFRDGRRFALGLEAGGGAAGSSVVFRPDASYLVTGGLGGLGLLAARWMAERGARRLILAGRSPLPPRERWSELEKGTPDAERVAAVRALEGLGVSVQPVALDVADEAQVDAFLERFHREAWPPLRGVVHAAGVLADQLLARMSADDFATAWRPKALGAWLLHRKLAAEPLDFFVLYSSVASVLGTFGQGNYAAANAFLDALAQDRRAAGLPALSVGWGPWAEVGMAARMDPASLQAHRGIELISPAEGLAYLGRAMAGGDAQVLAVRADWRAWAETAGNAPSELLVADVIERTEGDSSAAPAPTRGVLGEEVLALADRGERRALVEQRLLALCGVVARLEPGQLDPKLPLPALGFDSILTAEIRGQIKSHFGVEVPLSGMLLGASISKVAEQVLEILEGAPVEGAGAVPTVTAATGGADAEMSMTVGGLEPARR